MIQCLLEDPISADTMIKTLTAYNEFIGGGKAELNQFGLIFWNEEAPSKLDPTPLTFSWDVTLTTL